MVTMIVGNDWMGMFVIGTFLSKNIGTRHHRQKDVFNKFPFLIQRLNWFSFQFQNWKGSWKGPAHKEGTMFVNTTFPIAICEYHPRQKRAVFAVFISPQSYTEMETFLNFLGLVLSERVYTMETNVQTLVLFWLNMSSTQMWKASEKHSTRTLLTDKFRSKRFHSKQAHEIRFKYFRAVSANLGAAAPSG